VHSNSPRRLHFYLICSFQTKKSHILLEPPDDKILSTILHVSISLMLPSNLLSWLTFHFLAEEISHLNHKTLDFGDEPYQMFKVLQWLSEHCTHIAKRSNIFPHSMQLNPESQSFTLKSRCKNLSTRTPDQLKLNSMSSVCASIPND
jgi:hypothetical protein